SILSALAFIQVPSSICCFRVAWRPVSTTRSVSPFFWITSAVSAWISSVPWTMTTSPLKRHLPLSSTMLQSLVVESMVIGWLRSDDLDHARPGASRPASRTIDASLAGGIGFIAGLDLGKEGILPGLQVGLEAEAALVQARAGHGHALVGAGQVAVGEYIQRIGAEGGDRGLVIARAVAADVAAQAQFLAFGADPAGIGLQLPVPAGAVGQQEHRSGDVRGVVAGAALRRRSAQGGRRLAVLAQRDDLEVAQDVIRTLAVRVHGVVGLALLPRRPATGQCRCRQNEAEYGAPVHRENLVSTASSLPCAASSTSHSSRAAPRPPRARVCQCT